MKNKLFKYFYLIAAIWVVALITPAGMQASDQHGHGDEHHETPHQKAEEAEYNAGRMIIDHIIDSHEWHIMDIGKTHVSIPLPVILVDDGNLIVFMSSKLHHGHDSYKGYKLETKGEFKGKIVKVKEGTMERGFRAWMGQHSRPGP